MTKIFFGAAIAASALLAACGGNRDDADKPATPEVDPIEQGEVDQSAVEIPSAPESPLAEINKKKSEEFLAAEAAKDSVRALEDGLLIETTTEGNDKALAEGDMIRFHFTGELIDGTQLQDTRANAGEPLVVPSPIVPGLTSWDEIPIPGLPAGLAAMTEGERARIIVPPALAYGEEGVPNAFEPYTTLIFDVELVEIVKADDEARRAEVIAQQEAIIAEAEAERIAAESAQREAIEAIAAANREASEAFLADAKSKDGVQVTESGLAYEVLTDGGDGATPAATDTVTVHYKGTLPDGTEFDSSYSRGEPTSFPLNRVIDGWTEGVALMNVGDKYKFYIPSDLAYGPGGAGGQIGPDQALVFEVELLEIETPADQGGQ